jgi:cell division initiation protein
MRLTPIDLVNKRFTRSRNGYSIEEVEDYLREVSTDYEHALAANARLQEQLEGMERELERFQNLESTLKEALILAQTTANETRALAHRESEALLRDARAKADRMVEEAVSRTENLRQQRLRVGFELRAMLRANLDGVEAEIERSSRSDSNTVNEQGSTPGPSTYAPVEASLTPAPTPEVDGSH